MKVEDHLKLLGMKVEDKVTGATGIVTSISYDLYGCIQAIVDPMVGEDGKSGDVHWFDVFRLKVLSKKPVMETPDFQRGYPKEGRKGPAEKPVPTR